MMKRMIIGLSILFVGAYLCLTVNAQGTKEWTAPANFKTMKNPTAANKENQANGKELYAKHCKSCHGTAGLGDGSKAGSLDANCGDFSTAKFQGQADGEIFYKISEGRAKMPAFKKTIPEDNDRWNLVLYLRTLKAK